MTFTYGPPLPSHSIRLLTLHPGRGALRLTLTTHHLSHLPAYESLSYAWGSPRPAHLIFINSTPHFIPVNLFHALCQLRRNSQSLPIWIDALCINQSSNVEKSIQVRMMRQIYARANHVRIWLGTAGENDAAGLELLRKVHAQCGGDEIKPDQLEKDFSALEVLGLPTLEDNSSWKSLAGILYRPYFTRIWIVQELLVARGYTFLLGDWSVDGEVVLGVAGACERYRCVYDAIGVHAAVFVNRKIPIPNPGDLLESAKEVEKSMAVTPSIKILWFLRFTLAEAGGIAMLELLNNTRTFQATDPRDKIFAVVGLASDLDPAFVETFVDYEKTLVQVQTELAVWFLRQNRRAATMLLSYVEAVGHSDLLPSWVPDWTGEGLSQCSLAATYYSYEDFMAMPNPVVNRRIISNSVSFPLSLSFIFFSFYFFWFCFCLNRM